MISKERFSFLLTAEDVEAINRLRWDDESHAQTILRSIHTLSLFHGSEGEETPIGESPKTKDRLLQTELAIDPESNEARFIKSLAPAAAPKACANHEVLRLIRSLEPSKQLTKEGLLVLLNLKKSEDSIVGGAYLVERTKYLCSKSSLGEHLEALNKKEAIRFMFMTQAKADRLEFKKVKLGDRRFHAIKVKSWPKTRSMNP